jgi:ABC-type sulfate transport system permease component
LGGKKNLVASLLNLYCACIERLYVRDTWHWLLATLLLLLSIIFYPLLSLLYYVLCIVDYRLVLGDFDLRPSLALSTCCALFFTIIVVGQQSLYP